MTTYTKTAASIRPCYRHTIGMHVSDARATRCKGARRRSCAQASVVRHVGRYLIVAFALASLHRGQGSRMRSWIKLTIGVGSIDGDVSWTMMAYFFEIVSSVSNSRSLYATIKMPKSANNHNKADSPCIETELVSRKPGAAINTHHVGTEEGRERDEPTIHCWLAAAGAAPNMVPLIAETNAL